MSSATSQETSNDVFINCPFDAEYLPLFDAILFGLIACGFRPRCALEHADAGEVRIEKLYRLVRDCQSAIHDLSRVQLSAPSNLPRFNMPLELGIWLGAKRFGSGARNKHKVCLILDAEPHRYQRFVSDIAGQDPVAHGNDPVHLVFVIRNWLQTVKPELRLPGGDVYASHFVKFLSVRQKLAKDAQLSEAHLTYLDRVRLVEDWLVVNAVPATASQ